MQAIESGAADTFHSYLKRTKNTICGRNPIQILMHAVAHYNQHAKSTHDKSAPENTAPALVTRFVHYAQSSQCVSAEDSSVSYASALVAPPH